jgi:hypothetical protein
VRLDTDQDRNSKTFISWLQQHLGVAGGIQMMDLLVLAIGFGLFVLTVGYAYACERL